jgi:immune inhibitor A
MQLVQPIALPANAFVSLSFELAYDIEKSWDFLWIEISEDNGATWKQLTNAHTTSQHDPDWIGSAFGFPDDLAAAGIGGFSGQNADYPNYTRETFDLAAYAGKNILLKFWYMTDWSFAEAGPSRQCPSPGHSGGKPPCCWPTRGLRSGLGNTLRPCWHPHERNYLA